MNRFRALLLAVFSMLALHAAEPIVAVVNPALGVSTLSKAKAADLLKGDALSLNGRKVVIFLTKPSHTSLPAVTYGMLNLNPLAYLNTIKAARMRGIQVDIQFVDSPEAVETAVMGSANAIGFLAAKDANGPSRKIPIQD